MYEIPILYSTYSMICILWTAWYRTGY